MHAINTTNADRLLSLLLVLFLDTGSRLERLPLTTHNRETSAGPYRALARSGGFFLRRGRRRLQPQCWYIARADAQVPRRRRRRRRRAHPRQPPAERITSMRQSCISDVGATDQVFARREPVVEVLQPPHHIDLLQGHALTKENKYNGTRVCVCVVVGGGGGGGGSGISATHHQTKKK